MQLTQPFISLGLTVGNNEAGIAPVIYSILNQTVRDFELIVLDNASTDQTSFICQGFAAQDDRVYYYRNRSVMHENWNQNFMLNLATKPTCLLLDSSEILDLDFLENYLLHLESNGAESGLFREHLILKKPYYQTVGETQEAKTHSISSHSSCVEWIQEPQEWLTEKLAWLESN